MVLLYYFHLEKIGPKLFRQNFSRPRSFTFCDNLYRIKTIEKVKANGAPEKVLSSSKK